MLTDALLQAEMAADTVKQMISLGDKLRLISFDNTMEYATLRSSPIVSSLIDTTPESTLWRVFDHCAAVTRLYAIFERFIGECVRAWLGELPSLGAYTALPEGFRTVHRRGVARVLMDHDKARFSSLAVPSILANYLNAVNDGPNYFVLPEAFLNDSRSFQPNRINELLSNLGLNGGWQWITRSRHVVEFITEVRGGQNTADAELQAFINYRNEAAHGVADDFLGVIPLTQYVDFILSLCRAMQEFFVSNWVQRQLASGRVVRLGSVTERFRNNIVVCRLANCRIRLGTRLFVHNDNSCYAVTIKSLRVNDVVFEDVTVESETEVGMGLDQRVPLSADILIDTTSN
jgi:hypothetical protein